MQRKAIIESLEKQLKSVKNEATMIHAECFRVLNESKPAGYDLYTEYNFYKQEEAAVRKLFKREDGDLKEIYDNYMNGIYAKQNARKKQLDELKRQLDYLGIGENSGEKSMKVLVTNAKSILLELKKNFTQFTNETLSQIRKAKQAIHLIIDFRKKDAEKKIGIYEEYEKKLIKKFGNAKEDKEKKYKEKLAARKLRTREVFDESPPQEDRDVEVSRKVWKQLFPYKERMIKFTARFDLVLNKIDILDLDISKLEKQIQQLKTRKAELKEIRASQLYNQFSALLLKRTRQEEALDLALKECEERKNELMPRIEKERIIATQIVPGTNKTVRQLRAEIQNLIHQIGAETLDKSQYIKQINNAEREFSKTSDVMIETLEDEEKEQRKASK